MKSVRFRLEKRGGENPIWLTIYSDLMTNLMLFFLLMYGLSIMTEEMKSKVIEGLQTKFKPQMTDVRVKQILQRVTEEENADMMKHYIISENLRKYAAVEIDEHRIRIILRNPILYEPGGSVLKASVLPVLQKIAGVLAILDRPIIVEGHTDNRPVQSGTYASNWDLSLARALSVLRVLQENGVDPRLMKFEGHGEWRPLYPNDTELGRMFNRRVEIHVIREEKV